MSKTNVLPDWWSFGYLAIETVSASEIRTGRRARPPHLRT